MHTWLRITLLAICAATGIAVALAVALNKPVPAQNHARAAEQATADEPAVIRLPPGTGAPLAASITLAPPESSEPTPALAPYRDPVARQVGQLEDSIQQLEESSHRRERSMLRAIASIQDQMDDTQRKPAAPPPAAAPASPAPGATALEPSAQEPQAEQPLPAVEQAPPLAAGAQSPLVAPQARVLAEPRNDVRRTEGDDNLSINIQNTDLRAVLETISRETGLNIIASANVKGVVTANLNGVDLETALGAILKSTGYVAGREGNIIYVGLPTDLVQMNQFQDRIVTRIYRPNYVKAADLQLLFTPLLTVDGKITVSAASQMDIPADQTKTGGNGFAGLDTVVVRDYETILQQLDEIFAEVDVRPRQVAIEAMILSVKLSDTLKFGVNFEALRDQSHVKLVSGTPVAGLGSISVTDGGLHFGFLDGSLSTFINALEKVGDTNVIASPRLTCLNKQRAEIQIGEELGYVSTTVTPTSSTQTVNFLSVGTLLRIRPYIGNDGLIRLEVHPELSTGTVQTQGTVSLPQKAVTQVTTNVMCPDACTVVIGGLIREDLTNNTSQLPVLGNVPYVGWLFRQKSQGIDRNEIIVLITPRIVSEPFMTQEATKLGNEFTQRQSVYFNKMSPIGKRNLGQHHLRLARAAYNAGDFLVAMKQINLAIHYDPQSGEAVMLRNDIVAAGGFEDESIHEYLHRGLAPLSGRHHDYSRYGSAWKEFEGFGPPQTSTTDDQGTVGNTRTILRQPPRPHNPFDPEGPPVLRTAPPQIEPLPVPISGPPLPATGGIDR
jgi:type IV pilus assembly protein PilQ